MLSALLKLSSPRRSAWLAASCVATLFLAAVIPAMVYAAIFAFDLDDLGPLSISWVTLTFLVLFFAAATQALFADKHRSWPRLLSWFIGIWLAYWLWGYVITVLGYDRSPVAVLASDNTHPAMWGLPLVLGLAWWLKPSGEAVRRGLDAGLAIVFLIIGLRILLGSILPESQNIFGWSMGFGWWGLPFEQAPLVVDPSAQNAASWRSFHFNTYGVQVRPSFVFEHANTLGFFAAFSFVYGVARSARLGWTIAAVAAALLVASTSQTSVVAAGTGLACLFLFRLLSSTKRRKAQIAVIGCALGASGFAIWVVIHRSPQISGRLPLWESAISSFDMNVIKGTGGEALLSRATADVPFVGQDFHNSFLSAFAWSGLVGLVLFASLWVVGLWLGLRAAKDGNLITLALLATCFVSSMTESTFAYRYWSMGNALLLVAVLLSQPLVTRVGQLKPG